MTFDLSPWLTTVEAAAYLRTTPEALKKQIARGKIRPNSFGQRGRFRGHRFSRETLDAFLGGR